MTGKDMYVWCGCCSVLQFGVVRCGSVQGAVWCGVVQQLKGRFEHVFCTSFVYLLYICCRTLGYVGQDAVYVLRYSVVCYGSLWCVAAVLASPVANMTCKIRECGASMCIFLKNIHNYTHSLIILQQSLHEF